MPPPAPLQCAASTEGGLPCPNLALGGQAYCQVHLPLAVGPLISALGDARQAVKEAAVEALAKLGEAAFDPLVEVLQRDSHRSRVIWAAVTLGELGDERAIPHLETAAATDPEDAVRQAAADAVAVLRGQRIPRSRARRAPPARRSRAHRAPRITRSTARRVRRAVGVLGAVAVLVLVPLGLVRVVQGWARSDARDAAKAAAIMRDARGFQSSCDVPVQAVQRREPKVLVWDMSTDRMSPIHDLLPDGLKMHHKDARVTVAMILGTREELVGRYSISGAPAYRVLVDVCLLDWPTATEPHKVVITGFDPVKLRAVNSQPERGESDQVVADWIAGLPA